MTEQTVDISIGKLSIPLDIPIDVDHDEYIQIAKDGLNINVFGECLGSRAQKSVYDVYVSRSDVPTRLASETQHFISGSSTSRLFSAASMYNSEPDLGETLIGNITKDLNIFAKRIYMMRQVDRAVRKGEYVDLNQQIVSEILDDLVNGNILFERNIDVDEIPAAELIHIFELVNNGVKRHHKNIYLLMNEIDSSRQISISTSGGDAFRIEDIEEGFLITEPDIQRLQSVDANQGNGTKFLARDITDWGGELIVETQYIREGGTPEAWVFRLKDGEVIKEQIPLSEEGISENSVTITMNIPSSEKVA